MSKSPKTDSIDRFTSLPEHVGHEILKFLSMEAISKLSVVSRRCRQLCISRPYLSVKISGHLDAIERTTLMRYFDRLWLLRGGMSIQRLYIYWCLESCSRKTKGEEERRILSWVHNAIVCNVKDLNLFLILDSGSEFDLPPSLLNSLSLESLDVYIGNRIIKFPSYSSIGSFCSLKSLTLYSVRFDESFCHWVSAGCKFLEKLILERILETKSIVINSSSLQELRMSTMDYELGHLQVSAPVLVQMSLWWEFNSPNNRTLLLYTPRLRLFALKGNILDFPLSEDLACLNSFGSIFCPSFASTLPMPRFIRLRCDAVSLISSLDLAAYDLLAGLSEKGRVPSLFTSGLSLHILTTGVRYRLILLVESLFKGCSTPYRYLYIWKKVLPSHIEATEREDRESTKYCDAQNGTTFMQNLKFITVELISDYRGRKNLALTKYLLENAKYLQKMTILYAPPLESDVIGEIRGHEKASADVTVEFQPI